MRAGRGDAGLSRLAVRVVGRSRKYPFPAPLAAGIWILSAPRVRRRYLPQPVFQIGSVLLAQVPLTRQKTQCRLTIGGGISQAFMIARGSSMFAGGIAKDPLRVAELVPVRSSAISKIPTALGGFRPRSLFQSDRDAGFIDLDIVGPDFDRLKEIAGIALARLQRELPEAQAQPVGGVDRGKPELRIVPNRPRELI